MATMMTTRATEGEPTFSTGVQNHVEGIWREQFAQIEGYREVTFSRPLPMSLIDRYATLAVRQATVRRLDDGTWFAEIPGFDGVWADESSVADAIGVLKEVVFDWVLVKIEAEDRDLPVLGEIDLNAL
jgi:predicted RNase H-like HicB family nuclease